jgi:Zn-dependent peptidase ImmA (M78 family)
VEQSLGLKTEFSNPIPDALIKNGDDVEAAANRLRTAWSLGHAPITNVIELLEHNQVKVLVEKADTAFDGFSGWSGPIPVVVLNRTFSPDRMRIAALHEIGHLLVRFDPSLEDKAKEKLCHRFAGAMLMPRPVFEEEFGRHRERISVVELKEIKGDYGISIAAIMARAHDLGCISDGSYKQFCIFRNRAGWRENEPGGYKGETFPKRFEQLLHRAVATEAISLSLAANLAKKPEIEFQKGLQLIPS